MVGVEVGDEHVVELLEARLLHHRRDAPCVAALRPGPPDVEEHRLAGRGDDQRRAAPLDVDPVDVHGAGAGLGGRTGGESEQDGQQRENPPGGSGCACQTLLARRPVRSVAAGRRQQAQPAQRQRADDGRTTPHCIQRGTRAKPETGLASRPGVDGGPTSVWAGSPRRVPANGRRAGGSRAPEAQVLRVRAGRRARRRSPARWRRPPRPGPTRSAPGARRRDSRRPRRWRRPVSCSACGRRFPTRRAGCRG